MKSKRLWLCCVGLLLAGMAGCQAKTDSTPPAGPAVREPGCRVERLEAAEQAVGQLFEHSVGHVYAIDGDRASCKLEVFYRPAEASKETTLFSASGDSAADSFRAIAEAHQISTDQGNNHHVLSIVVPEYPPKPEDKYLFSGSLQCTSNDGKERTSGCSYRKSEEAGKLLPHPIVTAESGFSSSFPPPVGSRSVKRGEEATLVDTTFWRVEPGTAKTDPPRKLDLLRYKITVTCLPVK